MENPAQALYEQPKATGELNSSSDSGNSWKAPATKRQALDLLDIGARIGLSNDMAGNLVNFLMNIGADNELPSDDAEQDDYLNQFHMRLAVNNPLWPEEMSFGFVYGAFANAVMYNRVELKGHNPHAFITAFKNWITQSGVEDNLRARWMKTQSQKQLPKSTDETNHEKQIKAEGFVNESPATVKRLIETLESGYGSKAELMKYFPRIGDYVHRLYATREKMKAEGSWK